MEHVTIMANEGLNHWREDLNAFVSRGVLDVVDMEYPNHRWFFEQQVALQICNRHYRYSSQFVIYNDIDEFFLPLNTNERVVDVLAKYDRFYPSACAFIVSSVCVFICRLPTVSPPVSLKDTIGHDHTTHPSSVTNTT